LDEQIRYLFNNLDFLESEIGMLCVGLTGTSVPRRADDDGLGSAEIATLADILRSDINRRLEQARGLLAVINGAIQATVGEFKVCRVTLPPEPPDAQEMMRQARRRS
jgi:hypothetical protein